MLKGFLHFLCWTQTLSSTILVLVSFVPFAFEIIHKNSSNSSPSPSSQHHALAFPSVDFIIPPSHIPVLSHKRFSFQATVSWDLATFYLDLRLLSGLL